MSNTELHCIIEQLKTEREAREQLDRTFLSEGRKKYLIEEEKALVRRKYGMSLNKKLWI